MDKSRSRQVIKLLKEDSYLTSQYELIQLIGEGCFGKILKVRSKNTEEIIALKIEKFHKAKLKMVLKNQIQVLRRLQGKYGIPKIFNSGEWSNGTYLQMQLLDRDLNNGHKYTLPEIMQLTLQLIKIMNGMHDAQIIHQDLKPHNIMSSQNGHYYLIDYGLARQISIKKNHFSMKGFIGTPRYASVRAHNMFEQSKKDDLQSLFYNIAYLYYQKLPWSKLNVSNDKKLEKIKILKVKHRESLFKDMPPSFQRAFDYITSLQPFQEPNYQLLKGYFRRNKTLLFEHQPTQAIMQRAKIKRVSLNNSNFLQVPQLPFRKKTPQKVDDDKWCSGNSISVGSNNSSALISDVVIYDVQECKQNKNPSTTSIQVKTPTKIVLKQAVNSQNYGSQQNIQPKLPNIAKFARTLILKNPFG